MKSETNNFEIEKNIFLGNKNKIINNESISMSGYMDDKSIVLKMGNRKNKLKNMSLRKIKRALISVSDKSHLNLILPV